MKILSKKLKKVNKVKKFFYHFTSLIYLATFIYFVYGLLHLKNIETLYRTIAIAFFGIWFLIYWFSSIITMISQKNKTFIFMTLITLLCCPIFIFSSYSINYLYGKLKNMNTTEVIYTTNLISLKDTIFTTSSKIGMVDAEDSIENTDLVEKLIKKEKLESNPITSYEDYQSMILDLLNKKIDACFVPGNYALINIEGLDEDTSIEDKTKIIYSYDEQRKNEDSEALNSSKKKELTEPFTVLLMGVDSTKNGLKANQAFNGDTLIMVTFNPNTLTVTMFSIPRDMYVPIACNHNRYAKVNSSAAYGSKCVINTIQQLTNIDIDYYVKINFKGVVDFVNAIGGVEVNVEKPHFTYNGRINCNGKVCEQNSDRSFGKKMIYIEPGIQTLNGEQALAYARNRHQYLLSDIARNQHQQDIIEAASLKLKTIRDINDFKKILNAITNNVETNMTPDQILSFYDAAKTMLLSSGKETSTLSIKKSYLAYYNLKVWRGYNTSALGYYQTSLNAITKMMRENLELEQSKPIKTFSISYNEYYKTPLIGYGLNGGEKLETMPNFIGYAKDYVSSWCSSKNISCSFKSASNSAPANEIIDQSLHEFSLLKGVSSMSFTFSDGSLAQVTPVTPIEPTNQDDQNNNDNNDNNENNNDTNNNDTPDDQTPEILNP